MGDGSLRASTPLREIRWRSDVPNSYKKLRVEVWNILGHPAAGRKAVEGYRSPRRFAWADAARWMAPPAVGGGLGSLIRIFEVARGRWSADGFLMNQAAPVRLTYFLEIVSS